MNMAADVSAERAVLECMINDPDSIPAIRNTISSSDFFAPILADIYTAILSAVDLGTTPDLLTVSSRTNVPLENIQKELSQTAPDLSRGLDYARVVLDLSTRRRLQLAGGEIIARAGDPTVPISEIVTEANTGIMSARTAVNEIQSPPDIINVYKEHLNVLTTLRRYPAVSTGFDEFDNMIGGGLRYGINHGVGAVTSGGKSAFATQVISNALNNGLRVVLFSLEMSVIEIINRILIQSGTYTADTLDSPWAWTPETRADIEARLYGIANSELYIDDSAILSYEAIARQIEKVTHDVGKVDLLVIDHFHQMARSVKYGQAEALGILINQIRGLLKEKGIAGLTLFQFNREARNAQGAPDLSSIKYAGDIENALPVFAALHRPGLLDPTEPETAAELVIRKNRGGETNRSIPLEWDGQHVRFKPGIVIDLNGPIPYRNDTVARPMAAHDIFQL